MWRWPRRVGRRTTTLDLSQKAKRAKENKRRTREREILCSTWPWHARRHMTFSSVARPSLAGSSVELRRLDIVSGVMRGSRLQAQRVTVAYIAPYTFPTRDLGTRFHCQYMAAILHARPSLESLCAPSDLWMTKLQGRNEACYEGVSHPIELVTR
jgi:hypothetical protein